MLNLEEGIDENTQVTCKKSVHKKIVMLWKISQASKRIIKKSQKIEAKTEKESQILQNASPSVEYYTEEDEEGEAEMEEQEEEQTEITS